MQKELIQDFTRRISQCNRGGMIVVTYDIYFAYSKDAKEEYGKGDHEAFKEAVHKAQKVLSRLIGGLDFSYPIAKNLYALYMYSRNSLSKALYENRLEGIEDADRILQRLYAAFVEAAKQDASEPLMSNTQQVYAGMTYGKSRLNENYMENDQERGFFA